MGKVPGDLGRVWRGGQAGQRSAHVHVWDETYDRSARDTAVERPTNRENGTCDSREERS